MGGVGLVMIFAKRESLWGFGKLIFGVVVRSVSPGTFGEGERFLWGEIEAFSNRCFAWMGWGIEVNEEGSDFGGNEDRGEEEGG